MKEPRNHLTGIYRSDDPIDNLRIKLTLLKLNTLTQVFGSKNNAVDSFPDSSTTTIRKSPGNHQQQYSESVTFGWQQKQLGRHELRQFADAKNCHTDLQKKYNLLATEGHPEHNRKIFTYVHEDDHQSSHNNANDRNVSKWQDFKAAVRTLNGDSISMHIMAHLGADDSEAETELFVLKWCPRTSVLSVYPDFNDLVSSPYLHEITASSRHWYQYALEKVSPLDDADRDERFMEYTVGKLKSLQLSESSTITPAANFCNPAANGREFFVNVQLELLAAADFDCDRLYVRYTFHLPEHSAVVVTVDDVDDDNAAEKPLTSCTHSSQRRSHERIWSLCGPPHEINLLCRRNQSADRRGDGTAIIRITYIVYTINRWKQERIIGCAVHLLSLNVPGSVQQQLQCFRLVGSARKEPTVVDLEMFLLSSDQQPQQQQRYGVQTESAGRLLVRTQIVKQKGNRRRIDGGAAGDGIRRDQEAFNNRLSVDNVTDVLDAYERAKQRLLATAISRTNSS